jgi:hypothetical protein
VTTRTAIADELSGDVDALCDPAPPGYHPRESAVAAASLGVMALFVAIAARRRAFAGAR